MQARNPGCLEMEHVYDAAEHWHSCGSLPYSSACIIRRHPPSSRHEEVTQNRARDAGCTLG